MTTTQTRRPRITTTRQAIAKVYETMNRYADFGASDTEPRSVFAELLCQLANGEKVEVPQKASSSHYSEASWQLYSSMKGSFFAAKALARDAERVVKLAKASQEGMDGVVGYCREEGWI